MGDDSFTPTDIDGYRKFVKGSQSKITLTLSLSPAGRGEGEGTIVKKVNAFVSTELSTETGALLSLP
jgi:hypothetical protein